MSSVFKGKRGFVVLLTLLWVLIAVGLYLYQFLPLLPAILRTLGL